VDLLDLTDEPDPRFPVPGHILSVGGDALKMGTTRASNPMKRDLKLPILVNGLGVFFRYF
jgi:hypothetical protein